MVATVGSIAVAFSADLRRYEASLRAGEKTTDRFERNANKATTGVGQAFMRMGGLAKAGLAGLAAGLVAGGVTGIVGQFGAVANSIARIGDEAKRAGLSNKAFQELGYVAKANRIEVDALTDGMKELSLRADEYIATGKGSAAESFQRLGFTVDDLKTKLKDPSALFTEIIGKLGQLDKAAQIRIADELFGGTGGERFVQLIAQGEQGIKDTIQEAHNLGAVMSDEVIESAAELDRKPETDKAGIVCYITAAGFLAGPGFEKMRDDLRRDCESIWVIDCSPDGHQPEVATRIFQGVQQPVCIVLAVRTPGKDRQEPATVRYRALPSGHREEKFEALKTLSLDADGWTACPSAWRAPFLPEATGSWASFPAIRDFFVYNGSGVQPGRTWVIAPDSNTLAARWDTLKREKDAVEKERKFHPHLRDGKPGDKHSNKIVSISIRGHEHRILPVSKDEGSVVKPIRYGYRTLDRQWIIPDVRLINQLNPNLWDSYSDGQIFLTAMHRAAPSSGPAISFTSLIPDYDHYKGSFGGRAFPLWTDTAAKQPNVRPELLRVLAEVYGRAVSAPDLMAYLAATMAHPSFTARFAKDLVQPGLRVPLTADPDLFNEAVKIGREVIWLHTYGERFADPKADRPKAPPRMPPDQRPQIPADGTIPSAPEPLPDTMEYDAAKRRLKIGKGCIDNVSPQMWEYEVSGKQVIWHWFSYRRRDRTRPQIGDKRPPSPLEAIQPDSWLAEYTSDLIDLLNVIGRLVALEPRQAKLLDHVLDTDLIDLDLINEALADPSASTAASG